MRRLKEFYGDFFDKPPQSNEARDLGRETGQALDAQLATLNQLLNNQSLYPLLSELSEPIRHLKELVGKPYAFYLEDLPKQMDDLLDQKEHTIAPILRFWNGPQKALFDEARSFFQSQSPNFDSLEGDESEKLKAILQDSGVFRGNQMQQVRSLMEIPPKKDRRTPASGKTDCHAGHSNPARPSFCHA